MRVRLERVPSAGHETVAAAEEIAAASTDADGRVLGLGPEIVPPGTYRLIFDTGGYLARRGVSGWSTAAETFFPEVTVTFTVTEGEHYHVPLLMSPFGYSTYRGS